MKWYYWYLIFGGFIFSGFLIYSIILQSETILFIACATYLVFIIIFFTATSKIDNRKDVKNE